MTDEQIKHMVDRFLGWKLPENFDPDNGISFERFGNKGTPHQYDRAPSGTNLLDAEQATEMVRYMVAGWRPQPADVEWITKLVEAFEWEADGIESHLAVNAVRPSVNQKKTARLLRRAAAEIAARFPAAGMPAADALVSAIDKVLRYTHSSYIQELLSEGLRAYRTARSQPTAPAAQREGETP